MAQLGSLIVTGDSRFLNTINGNISGTAANVRGTVAVGNGGTGATTAAAALTNLGAAASGHTHSISIAADSGTNQLTMAANTKYKITAGGQSYIFTTPPDNNTNNAVTQTATSTSADYEVLFSVTADNTTRTEGARKNSNLKFNPSTGNLQATQLNGVTIGSSPKFTDNNTHRPIQVKGTQILGDNTTALNFNNGTNITLSNSSGTVIIGQQYVLRKVRKRVPATGWSNSTNANGYYSLSISIGGYKSQDYTYPPNVYIAGSTDSTFPTDAEKEQYALLEQCESQYSSVDAGIVVLYAKTKPTADFYVYVELMLQS